MSGVGRTRRRAKMRSVQRYGGILGVKHDEFRFWDGGDFMCVFGLLMWSENGASHVDGEHSFVNVSSTRWLDWSAKRANSYDYVSTQFESGSEYLGYRYASKLETGVLFQSFGLAPARGWWGYYGGELGSPESGVGDDLELIGLLGVVHTATVNGVDLLGDEVVLETSLCVEPVVSLTPVTWRSAVAEKLEYMARISSMGMRTGTSPQWYNRPLVQTAVVPAPASVLVWSVLGSGVVRYCRYRRLGAEVTLCDSDMMSNKKTPWRRAKGLCRNLPRPKNGFG
jgi:hypothetical protein